MTTTKTLPSAKHFTLQQLADGVYAAYVKEHMGAFSNGGFVDLGESVLVIDAFLTPQAAQELRDIAEAITGHPVRHMVNTHWHGDHVRGNQVYADVAIIATDTTKNLIAEHLPPRIEAIRAQAPAQLKALQEQFDNATDEAQKAAFAVELAQFHEIDSTFHTLQITVPNVTFENKMTLHGTRRSAELITLGGGHSPSDIFVYLPQDKIIFMGDLLFVNNQLACWNANEREWVQILEQIEAFDAVQFVPGHGPLGTLEDVRANKQYLLDLLQLVEAHIADGGTEAGLADLKVPAAYEAWEFGSIFPGNVQKLYAQLKNS
ncbi:glyoxylase-like metal-dependent hydrolase (beta-lactamase superfamily II) [Tumebacillus sp. BK434]|uniref:MBL fold metallo-hydrolase n=1 Tax=Tumebacillus sp. BK434 TaxID=2512169 RepID=UPI0010D42CB2|nr:MBL fold metallo-hydrolase [Tumebacillus sp. BK434]TCP55617.1 glyoxylase-like metal-dependent hydrolase (beta-lactamase superfamily II) [Tumebacillus sp. BK434]